MISPSPRQYRRRVIKNTQQLNVASTFIKFNFARMQIPASIRILLPFKLKTITVIMQTSGLFWSHPAGTCPRHGERGQRIRNTGVQEGTVFREETEGGSAEAHRDPGHQVVKLTLLQSSLRPKCVINRYNVLSTPKGIQRGDVLCNHSKPQTTINCPKIVGL